METNSRKVSRPKSMLIGDLIFPNMHIIACNDLKNAPFQLILSATMFQNLIYEIDNKHHKLNVTIPDDESTVRNLRIKDSNGRLHVLCNSGEPSERLSFYIKKKVLRTNRN